MKKKDLEVLRTKDIQEVKKSLKEKKAELAKLFVEIYGGKEKNIKKGRNLRREIAQYLTIIKEREYIEQNTEENPPHTKATEDKK